MVSGEEGEARKKNIRLWHKPDMGHFHRHGEPVDKHHSVTPAELIGLARRKHQRHKCRRGA